jgi:hypothetical protein
MTSVGHAARAAESDLQVCPYQVGRIQAEGRVRQFSVKIEAD